MQNLGGQVKSIMVLSQVAYLKVDAQSFKFIHGGYRFMPCGGWTLQLYIEKAEPSVLEKDGRRKWAISELLFVSVLKRVLVLNYWKGNEFVLHKNTQLISIWMVVDQDSLWNWGMQQLENGLLFVAPFFSRHLLARYPKQMSLLPGYNASSSGVTPSGLFSHFFVKYEIRIAMGGLNQIPVGL